MAHLKRWDLLTYCHLRHLLSSYWCDQLWTVFFFFSTGRWVCISTEDVALSYLVLETGQSQAHSCFMLQHTLNCHSQTKISLQPLSSSLCVSAAQSWSVAERHIKHPPKTSSANVSQRTTAGHSSYKIYIQDKYTCSIMDMTSRSGCWTTVLVPVYKHRRRSSSTWTVYQSLPHSSLQYQPVFIQHAKLIS